MNFHIVTIFPKALDSYLGSSILARAIRDKKITVKFYNPRDFTRDKHHKVDDKPYGGGVGMVMMAEPILAAATDAIGRKKKVKTIIMSPRGKAFTNKLAATWARNYKDLVIVSGRYEGIDARVKKILSAEEISVGPYTLSGGELPAAVIVDAVSRQVKDVLGNQESIEESRTASPEVYTRPEVINIGRRNYRVPKVLTDGNHKEIEGWRGGG